MDRQSRSSPTWVYMCSPNTTEYYNVIKQLDDRYYCYFKYEEHIGLYGCQWSVLLLLSHKIL